MRSFRSRSPVRIGLVSGVLLLVAALLTLFWDDLPGLGGTTYTAEFGEAAGLKAGDEVRIAGTKAGKVTRVALAGDHVEVTFRVDDAWVGDQTVAAIHLKTVLGAKDLALDPRGDHDQDPAPPIPLARTVSPYDVTDAFGDLATTVDQLDTSKLADAFRSLSQTFDATTPEDVRGALTGLASLSQTISSRDTQLKQLLAGTAKVSGVLAQRTDQVAQLISDGTVLLGEFQRRRQAIGSLLEGTRSLAQQVKGLIDDNSARLGPALEQLDRVTDVLQRNQNTLDRSLSLAGPFYRLVGDAMGNGAWIDTYVCGLVATGTTGCMPPKPGGGH
ncbi:MCE family protein [Amycolatopsis rhizosphaerae]|uniref:MCE family protein n=1 Tax=Amycolatopsis rhizosphaerae TaxID=2053003 RepID=A0A558D5J5_9PSEU|nr:MCE family protein [Amycolatopsis rhizosphaerae]TVT56287.1 MCE family protein [Amycolatopsis rhizosphaerae]